MEVATALLEASRKLSTSTDSNTSTCSATASWSSSVTEMNDKTSDLPNSASWMGAWGRRTRAYSESESGGLGVGMGSWLFGGVNRQRSNSGASEGWAGHTRARRSSSKDVEEAMAAGLNKTEIFMPPM